MLLFEMNAFLHIYILFLAFSARFFSPSFSILMYLLLLRFQFSFSFRLIFKWNDALYMHIYNINHKQRRIKCDFYSKLKQPLKIFHINTLSYGRTFLLGMFVKQFEHQCELKCICRVQKRAWELWICFRKTSDWHEMRQWRSAFESFLKHSIIN